MVKRTILVRAEWDPEAGVFVATSGDVVGLVAEGRTLDELNEKLKILIPELLELNGSDDFDGNDCGIVEVPLVVMSEQISKIRLYS